MGKWMGFCIGCSGFMTLWGGDRCTSRTWVIGAGDEPARNSSDERFVLGVFEQGNSLTRPLSSIRLYWVRFACKFDLVFTLWSLVVPPPPTSPPPLSSPLPPGGHNRAPPYPTPTTHPWACPFSSRNVIPEQFARPRWRRGRSWLEGEGAGLRSERTWILSLTWK